MHLGSLSVTCCTGVYANLEVSCVTNGTARAPPRGIIPMVIPLRTWLKNVSDSGGRNRVILRGWRLVVWYLAWIHVWVMLLHKGLVGHVLWLLRVALFLFLLVGHAGLEIRLPDHVSWDMGSTCIQ